MKTALDWLIEQMPYEFRANHTQELFKKAKEKEKKQILDAYNQADLDGYLQKIYPKYAEEYYKKTYNQNK